MYAQAYKQPSLISQMLDQALPEEKKNEIASKLAATALVKNPQMLPTLLNAVQAQKQQAPVSNMSIDINKTMSPQQEQPIVQRQHLEQAVQEQPQQNMLSKAVDTAYPVANQFGKSVFSGMIDRPIDMEGKDSWVPFVGGRLGSYIQDRVLYGNTNYARRKGTKPTFYNTAEEQAKEGSSLAKSVALEKVKRGLDAQEAAAFEKNNPNAIATSRKVGDVTYTLDPKADLDRKIAEKQAMKDLEPATSAQETASLYAARMVQANKVFDALEKTNVNKEGKGELSHQGFGAWIQGAKGPLGVGVPNFMKSSEFQAYDQAKRNFVNAVLRRESGAAIAPSEFESAQQQYFPAPGDKAEVIKQKAENRRVAIEYLIKASGKAFDSSIIEPVPVAFDRTAAIEELKALRAKGKK